MKYSSNREQSQAGNSRSRNTRTCRFFLRGNCTRSECHFSHDVPATSNRHSPIRNSNSARRTNTKSNTTSSGLDLYWLSSFHIFYIRITLSATTNLQLRANLLHSPCMSPQMQVLMKTIQDPWILFQMMAQAQGQSLFLSQFLIFSCHLTISFFSSNFLSPFLRNMPFYQFCFCIVS